MPNKNDNPFRPQTFLTSIHDPQYNYQENHYVLSHLFGPGRYPLHGGVYKRWMEGEDGRSPHDPSFFTLEENEGLVRSYTEEIQKGWKRDRTLKGLKGSVLPGWAFSSEQSEWVIGAVQKFNIDALRLFSSSEEVANSRNSADPRRPLFVALNRLGKEVCRVLRFWRYRAECGSSLEERREATKCLRKSVGH